MRINELDISLPYSWTHGSAGYYQNHLYLINGINCSMTTCDTFTKKLQYSLNISNIILSQTDSKNIIFTSTTKWIQTTITKPPLSYAIGSQSSGSIYYNDKIYIIHPDYEINNYSLQYSMTNNKYLSLDQYSWDISGSILLRDPCTTHNTTHIFSIGGLNLTNGTGGSLSRCDAYNIHTDSWTQISNLNIHRHNSGCSTINQTVYVLGGQNTYNDYRKLDSIEAYDINTNHWTLLNVTLNTKRAGHACITHINNKWILCFGGFATDRIEIFDPVLMDTVNTTMIYEGFGFGHILYPIDEYNSILFIIGGIDDIATPWQYMNTIKYIVLSLNDSDTIVNKYLPLPTTFNPDNLTITSQQISDLFKLYILYNDSDYKSQESEFNPLMQKNTVQTFIEITQMFDYNVQKQTGDIINLTFCAQYNILYDVTQCEEKDLLQYDLTREHAEYLSIAYFKLTSNQMDSFIEYAINVFEGFVYKNMLTQKMKSNNQTLNFDIIAIYVQVPENETIIPSLNLGNVSTYTIIYVIIGLIGVCVVLCLCFCCICSFAERSAFHEAKQTLTLSSSQVEMSGNITENQWNNIPIYRSSNEKERVHRITTLTTNPSPQPSSSANPLNSNNSHVGKQRNGIFEEINDHSDSDVKHIETQHSKTY